MIPDVYRMIPDVYRMIPDVYRMTPDIYGIMDSLIFIGAEFMDKVVKKEKSLELKKHVGAIHSSNNMSLLQRKITNALLYHAYFKLSSQDEYQIHLKDLCKSIGYNSNDYKKLKQSFVDLLSTVVEWNLLDKSSPDDDIIWNASSILSAVSIKGSLCTYSYSKIMRQRLSHPTVYGRIDIELQCKFQSSYGLALYENCIRYQNLEYTPWLEIEVFKKLMGVPESQYKEFSDFKRRVIDAAVNEVNSVANIIVDYEFRKAQRRVAEIRFSIKNKNKNKKKNIDNTGDDRAPNELGLTEEIVRKKLKIGYGMAEKQISKIMTEFSTDYIIDKMSIIEQSQNYLNGKIGSLAGYLYAALKHDYQPPKTSKEITDKNQVKSYEEIKADEEKQKKHEEAVDNYRYYKAEKIANSFQSLNEIDKKNIEDQFIKFLGRGWSDTYARDGLSNAIIRDKFADFTLSSGLPIANGGVMSLEDFINSNSNNKGD